MLHLKGKKLLVSSPSSVMSPSSAVAEEPTRKPGTAFYPAFMKARQLRSQALHVNDGRYV
jgi:hypothetical protein